MVFPIVMYGCENKLTKTKQMNKHKIEKMRLIYTENKLVMAAKGKGVGEISETGEGD